MISNNQKEYKYPCKMLFCEIYRDYRRAKRGSFCRYRKALYFWSLGISLYLELFCFLSFITIVLRNLCSGTHRRNPKRGLSLIWPYNYSYETAALDKTALSTLSDRWAVSCIEFIVKIRPGNPLYPLIHNRVVPISTSVCLRSGSSSRPMATRTERFSNFVSVKY